MDILPIEEQALDFQYVKNNLKNRLELHFGYLETIITATLAFFVVNKTSL